VERRERWGDFAQFETFPFGCRAQAPGITVVHLKIEHATHHACAPLNSGRLCRLGNVTT